MRGYLAALRSYGTTTGRASRYEYWMFNLGYALVIFGALIVDAVVFGQPIDGSFHPLSGLLNLAHIIPAVAVLVRRLHDLDRTGHWAWLLLTGVGGIVLLVFALMPGTRGANRYGHSPYGEDGFEAAPAAQNAFAGGRDVTMELERLAALKRDGALTDAEYDTLKGRLLGLSA